jgi:hypothetical protein
METPQAQNVIKVKLIGNDTEKWPMINELWDFYNKKGIKTVFFSVGNTSSAYVDLEVAETLGCPINLFGCSDETMQKWEEVKQILKSRKRPDTAALFSEGAETKWVLPKNIRFYPDVPSFNTFQTAVQQVISSMNLTEERIDVLKVALGNGAEKAFVYALMDSPYRPGLLLVQWSLMPDTDLPTTLCAGHLQTCGYTLMANKEDKFLYHYNDRCMYEICSWETNKTENPMISEVVAATTAGNSLTN